MISTCSITRGSALDAYNYNARKFFKSQADVVEVRNCAGGDAMIDLKQEIRQREDEGHYRSNTRNFGFHFTLDPGPADDTSDEQCVELIHEMLKASGLQEQPYAIFRHYDIEREHFHIVGSRIRLKGGVVKDAYWGLKMKTCLEENEKTYNYHYGGMNFSEDLDLEPAFLRPGQNALLQQIRVNYEEALRYDFETPQQFAAILASMGVGVTERLQRASKRKKVLAFYGIDEDGTTVTRHFSAGKDFKKQSWTRLQEKLQENVTYQVQKKIPESRRNRIILQVSFMLDEARSLAHLNNMIAPFGLKAVRTPDGEAAVVSRTRNVIPLYKFSEDDRNRLLSLPLHAEGEGQAPSREVTARLNNALKVLSAGTPDKEAAARKHHNTNRPSRR